MKFKYTRKEIVKIIWKDVDVNTTISHGLENLLLETIPVESKEEQSQRIMMEQVDKNYKPKKDEVWIEHTGLISPNTGEETIIIHNVFTVAKKDKPVECTCAQLLYPSDKCPMHGIKNVERKICKS